MRRLYRCNSCASFYENKKRAILCHSGNITKYVGKMVMVSKSWYSKEVRKKC